MAKRKSLFEFSANIKDALAGITHVKTALDSVKDNLKEVNEEAKKAAKSTSRNMFTAAHDAARAGEAAAQAAKKAAQEAEQAQRRSRRLFSRTMGAYGADIKKFTESARSRVGGWLKWLRWSPIHIVRGLFSGIFSIVRGGFRLIGNIAGAALRGIRTLALGAAAAVAGIGTAAFFAGRNATRGFAELDRNLRRFGTSFNAYQWTLGRLTRRAGRTSNYNRADVVNVLNALMQGGANLQQAEQALFPTLDYAAAIGDVGTAARQVSRTYGGQVGELGERLPGLAQRRLSMGQDQFREFLMQGGAVEELQKVFAGAAAAQRAADPLAGTIGALKQTLEEIGLQILPTVNRVLIKLRDWLNDLADFFRETDLLQWGRNIWSAFRQTASGVLTAIGQTLADGVMTAMRAGANVLTAALSSSLGVTISDAIASGLQSSGLASVLEMIPGVRIQTTAQRNETAANQIFARNMRGDQSLFGRFGNFAGTGVTNVAARRALNHIAFSGNINEDELARVMGSRAMAQEFITQFNGIGVNTPGVAPGTTLASVRQSVAANAAAGRQSTFNNAVTAARADVSGFVDRTAARFNDPSIAPFMEAVTAPPPSKDVAAQLAQDRAALNSANGRLASLRRLSNDPRYASEANATAAEIRVLTARIDEAERRRDMRSAQAAQAGAAPAQAL